MLRYAVILCLALVAAAPLRAEQVTIFAAASLKGALDKVVQDAGLQARLVYGGSAAMARQVAQGAEADIVLLAHSDWMDWLEAQDLLAEDRRCDLLGNRLVLAGAAEREDLWPKRADDLITALGGGRLAVGNLRAVPAGQYAAAYLERMGWLDALRPHLAETGNVRLALQLVARGEAPLGFVYASDVVAEPRVRAVFVPEQGDVPPIRYPVALAKSAGPEAAVAFDKLLGSKASFELFGFQTAQLGAGACP